MDKADEPRVMTTDQAAAYMGAEPKTLMNWRCNGRQDLPFIRVGGKFVRYRRSDIDAFLDRNTQRTA